MFAGMTLFEDGLGREPVWIQGSAHWINCAMTGSGKLITSLGPNGILHPGSAVFISPKPEIADLMLGRRVDPGLFSKRSITSIEQGLGVDPRGITETQYHIQNSRSFLFDPSGQSVYQSIQYNFLGEVDLMKPNARSLLLAIASGSFPDKKDRRADPWFTNTPRGLLAAGIAHKLTTDPNPANHNLAAVVDMLMGIDPKSGIASPKNFEATLKAMMGNNSLDGFVQSGASNVYQLGERAFGNINSEVENNCRWATDG
jgi:type IV secretory pathway TraG/TraD family ATPase VirD4